MKAGNGYTFHQHYDKLGLINMNRPKGAHDNTAKINHRVGVTFGRVYDPIVGRFLSVDPLVGNPLSAQDYNGYSYCANNPMKYTDPSGYTYWKHEGNGEWSHFEYHPFQNGSANFREASNGGVAYYGASMTYRYAAGQYRDEKGNVVSYEAVHKNYIAPNSAKVESYSALLDYLSAGFSFRYETAGIIGVMLPWMMASQLEC